MKIVYDGFQWDEGNIDHCAKHGVTREEIEFVLENMTFSVPDPHEHEPRTRTAGTNEDGRYVFIVFTIRDLDNGRYIRPISARYMRDEEIEAYEQSKRN